MKKSELITGIILTLAGAAALAAAILTETSFNGIFWGIAGAGLCLGLGKVISWLHWSSPAQADKLKELQESKEIAQHDELNRMIMDKAGRIAYNVGYEKVFPIHSPNVVSIDTIRRGKVRRAKLYYLRDRVGKQAKVKEKL